MKLRHAINIVLLLAITTVVGAQSAERILPDDFLRSWDPITLVFDEEVGPQGGGPADDPGSLFRIMPEIAGEYRWHDSKTLQFFPAETWPPLETIEVVSGDRSFSLHTLMASPTSMSPSNGTTNLNPVSQFSFTLPDWVDEDRLANMIEIESRPLPGLNGQDVVVLDQSDFTVRVQDPNPSSSRVSVVVNLNEPIGYGRSIRFSIKLSESAEIDGAHVASYEASTKPVFRLVQMGAGSMSLPVGADGSRYATEQAIAIRNQTVPLYLQFSERLAHLTLEEVKQMVSFTPAIDNFSYEVSGNRLYLHLNGQIETPYHVEIANQPISSTNGRVLAPAQGSSFSFYFQKQEPYIRWNRGEAVVERFGPQYFPMEGRGVDQVDLRIYRIDPLDTQFWTYSTSPLSVDEEDRPPMPGMTIQQRDQAIRAMGSPDYSRVVSLPIDESSPATSFGMDLSSYFAQISGENAPGTYLVGYRELGNDDIRHYIRVTVTDLNLSVVEEEHGIAFFVTSLKTGEPIEGAQIILDGNPTRDYPANRNGYHSYITGTTDSSGKFYYAHTSEIDGRLQRLTVSKDEDVVNIDLRNAPPVFSGNHWSGSYSSWLGWLTNRPVTAREEAKNRGYILTERPIYRPGETVHILGYVRNRMTGQILPDNEAAERRVDVRGPGGTVWTYDVELDDYGQFTIDFLEEDVPTGNYVANLFDATRNEYLSSASFQIESYRVPRFEVQIQAEDEVPVDQPFSLSLTAEYYAGGLVAERPVLWRVTESSFNRRPVNFPGFTFSSYENIGSNARNRASGVTRQNVTDENGVASLTIDPTTRQSANAVRYVIEGEVEGADGQRVTAVKAVTALPPFSVGIRQDRFVRSGNALTPEIVVLDFAGDPLPGIELGIRIYQRQWHSYLMESDFVTGGAEYRSDVVDELVREDSITSGESLSTLNYTMDESGVYIIEISARDSLGRLQTVRIDSYIPGTSPVVWERNEGSVFETTPDKDRYRPGDTARILLQSPYQDATALAVVERPDRVDYEWIDITGGQAIYEVEIDERMVPRLPVHFLLMRGRVEGTGTGRNTGFDRGRPASLANSTYLNVAPVNHQVLLDLDYPESSLPGESIEVDIEMTDYYGNPLNGQVALWLVDRAVLSLAEERPIQPLEAFIDPVTSAITLRDTRNEVVGNIPYRENPGGGGWDDAEASSLLDRTTVRQNFQTVPYFNSAIEVKNGHATVTIDLPDNLTDFAVRAVAVSGYSRFGVATGTLSVRLPVIIQSALPRFVRPGDDFSAGGIARIVEGEGGNAAVEIDTQGVELASGQNPRRIVELDRGISSRQYYDMEVPDYFTEDSVTITLGVERLSDGKSDAFSIELPVVDEVLERSVATVIQSSPGTEVPFLEDVPDFRPGTLSQNLIISTDRDVLQTISGLDFIEETPRETTEQRVNSMRARFSLNSLLGDLEFDQESQVSQVEWEEYLSYLDTVIDSHGLYAQFPGADGLISLSAWVLDSMTQAKAAGLHTPETPYRRLVRTLQDSLRSDYQYLISEYSVRERAEALLALSGAGEFDRSYADSFIQAANMADMYAAAILIQAYDLQDEADGRRVSSLADELWDRTTYRQESGVQRFIGLNYQSRNWGGYLMNSDIRTIAAVLKALAANDPRDERIAMILEYLLRQGDGNGWGTSIDTYQVLDTLQYLLSRRDRRSLPNIRFTLSFGDESERIATRNTPVTVAGSDAQVVGSVTQANGGREEPWLLLRSRYVPDLLASQIPAENNGVVVSREMQIIADDRVSDRLETASDPLRLENSTLVEEHITVVSGSSRYYIAVHVPLAAGMEYLNPALDTSGPEANPSGRNSHQPTYVRVLDDSVTYYFTSLPSTTLHLYFRERATFNGVFQLPPVWVEAIYDPEVWGNSAGAVLTIHD